VSKNRAFGYLLLLWLGVGGCISAYGQGGRGTINGTVADPTGAVVPGTHVVIKNLDTGQIREVMTGYTGGYNAPFLPLGRFTVSADHPGFKQVTQEGITLTADQVATVNLTLVVGQTQEHVEVSADQVQLDTTSATLGQVIDGTEIRELPLNGRNPATLAFLVPGGTDGTGSGAMQVAGQGAGSRTKPGPQSTAVVWAEFAIR
jgi:hypothetical protein